jgi:hypothetical protein
MQHQDDAQLGVPALLGESLQSLGSNLEQQAVEDLRIVTRQI